MNPLIRSDKATMPFIARNYDKNPAAPLDKDKWVDDGKGNELGQCVSLVKFLIPELRGVSASHGWTKGLPAFGNGAIQPGTAIATFNAAGHYFGHAAIYVSQDAEGMTVIDQWVTPPAKAIGSRQLKADPKHTGKNNAKNYYVVE